MRRINGNTAWSEGLVRLYECSHLSRYSRREIGGKGMSRFRSTAQVCQHHTALSFDGEFDELLVLQHHLRDVVARLAGSEGGLARQSASRVHRLRDGWGYPAGRSVVLGRASETVTRRRKVIDL